MAGTFCRSPSGGLNHAVFVQLTHPAPGNLDERTRIGIRCKYGRIQAHGSRATVKTFDRQHDSFCSDIFDHMVLKTARLRRIHLEIFDPRPVL